MKYSKLLQKTNNPAANIGLAKCGDVLNCTSLLFIRKSCFAFVFLLNLPKVTAFASFGSELNFCSIQAHTSPSRGSLAVSDRSSNIQN